MSSRGVVHLLYISDEGKKSGLNVALLTPTPTTRFAVAVILVRVRACAVLTATLGVGAAFRRKVSVDFFD